MLIDEVSVAIAEAMRRRDTARLSALRMLKAALINKEVEKSRAVDEAESRQVVTSLVKQRKDSIEQFKNAGRQDLVDKESADLAVLEAYLQPSADSGEWSSIPPTVSSYSPSMRSSLIATR